MKITEVRLCNYKNYRGLHRLDINTNSSKNIILLGGANGAGKTSLFDAFRLCIFGSKFDPSLTKQDYEKLIRSIKNKKSKRENDNQFFIELSLLLDDGYPVYEIDVRREWTIEDEALNERLSIFYNNKPFEIVPHEYWQEYLLTLIPPYTANYFFFDAERTKELLESGAAESILKETARDLMGLKLYDTLVNDLESIQARLRKKADLDERKRSEIEAIDKMMKEKQMEKELLQNDWDSNQDIVKAKRQELYEIKAALERKAGSYASQREELQKKISENESKINQLTAQIMELCEHIPFILASDICKRLEIQLRKERLTARAAASSEVVKSAEKKILNLLERESKLSSNDLAYVVKAVKSVYLEFTNGNGQKKEKSIHNLSDSSIDNILWYLTSIEDKDTPQIKRLISEREAIEIDNKKTLTRMKKIAEDSVVGEDITNINQLSFDIEKRMKENESLLRNIMKLEGEMDSLSKRKEEVELSALKSDEDMRKIQVCNDVIQTVEQFTIFSLSTRTHELQDTISDMYRNIANKDDMIREVRIDPQTFEISLLGYDGNTVSKEHISAGEKEIFALSVLWGLSRMSRCKLPVMVDSLLARLDSSHVNNIAQKFLPNAGEQVIVFSHDREVNKEMYKKMKPYISKEYLLLKDEVNKVKPGYFFEA